MDSGVATDAVYEENTNVDVNSDKNTDTNPTQKVGVRIAALEGQLDPKMVQEAAHEGRTVRHISRYEA